MRRLCGDYAKHVWVFLDVYKHFDNEARAPVHEAIIDELSAQKQMGSSCKRGASGTAAAWLQMDAMPHPLRLETARQ